MLCDYQGKPVERRWSYYVFFVYNHILLVLSWCAHDPGYYAWRSNALRNVVSECVECICTLSTKPDDRYTTVIPEIFKVRTICECFWSAKVPMHEIFSIVYELKYWATRWSTNYTCV